MRKTFHTPEGIIERELTNAEVLELAKMGDVQAKREVLIKTLASIGVHSYTPSQVDAFIDSISTVSELRSLLKVMAKAILYIVQYLE